MQLNPNRPFAQNVNAIGYNVKDNFIYGLSQINTSYASVIRIGSNGAYEVVTTNIFMNLSLAMIGYAFISVGDIDEAGYYWLSLGLQNSQYYMKMDLTSTSSMFYGHVVAYGPTSGGNQYVTISDWAAIDGSGTLYGLGQHAYGGGNYTTVLVQFDKTLTVGALTYGREWLVNGSSITTGSAGTATWGAVFSSLNGYVYGVESGSGATYRFKLVGAGPNDYQFISQGLPGGPSDGARCILAGGL